MERKIVFPATLPCRKPRKTDHQAPQTRLPPSPNSKPNLSLFMKTADVIPQLETDLWFAHSRPVLTISEVARAFAMSENQVRAQVDQGVFVGAPINCESHLARVHLRIERWSVIAWRLNLLADQGQELPFKETPQVTWWRQELRDRTKPKRRTTTGKTATPTK